MTGESAKAEGEAATKMVGGEVTGDRAVEMVDGVIVYLDALTYYPAEESRFDPDAPRPSVSVPVHGGVQKPVKKRQQTGIRRRRDGGLNERTRSRSK